MSSQNWERVERLFHMAMEKPNDRRKSYLRAAADNDAEYEACLRLIVATENADDFMSTSIGLEPFSASLHIGDILGNWRIDSILGSGGMGEVYRVTREAGDFEHIAALKLARTKDPKYLMQFEQERQTLAKLEHANIGRLIDGGTTTQNLPYFVMELVEGASITEHVKTQALDETQRLAVFTRLCQAVSHAHTRLVLHRDIKPPNVLVSREGQLKLIDFGTSGILENGQILSPAPLTKAYAAPEQLAGDVVSTATDIYALGCLLHEVLVGTRIGSDVRIADTLPTDLQYIIQKCVQEAPKDRYASVDALATDIAHYIKKEPVLAHVGGWQYRFAKFVSRHKFSVGVSTLLAASLVAGLGSSLTLMRKAQASDALSQRAALDQEYEARVAQGYRYGLQRLYGEDKSEEKRLDPKLIDMSMLEIGLEAKENFDGASLEDAFLLYSMGANFMHRQDYKSAAILLEPLQNLPMSTPILTYLSLESRSDLARSWVEIGNNAPAQAIARQLLIDRPLYGRSHNVAHVQDAQTIAKITGDKEDEQTALDILQATILKEEAANTDGDHFADLQYLNNQMGYSLFRRGKMKEAVPFFEKAFEINRLSEVNTPDDITSATNLAQFQLYINDDGASPLKYLHEYLPYAEKFGDIHRYALIQGLRSQAAGFEENWELMEEAARLAIPKIEGHRHYRNGWYYRLVVLRIRALSQLGRAEEAAALLSVAQTDFKQEPVDPQWKFSQCRIDLAQAYLTAFTGDTLRSQTLFDKAEALCETSSLRDWSRETVMQNEITRMKRESLQE